MQSRSYENSLTICPKCLRLMIVSCEWCKQWLVRINGNEVGTVEAMNEALALMLSILKFKPDLSDRVEVERK